MWALRIECALHKPYFGQRVCDVQHEYIILFTIYGLQTS